jgi:hypothetical protein
MRVAYCFSGYLRRFWDNPTLLEHVLRRAPGDLFVHTWDTLNYAGSTWHGDSGLALVPVDADVVEMLTGQYGTFARLVVEHPPAFPAALMPVIQARYSCWRSNRLKAEREQELGARYDLVLNLRFDLVVHDPFDFPETIGSGVMHCLANRNCVMQGLCCDILNFGSSPTMDAVVAIYEAMTSGKVPVEADANSGERYLTKWCTQRGIPFRYVAARCSLQRTDASLLELPV